VKGAVLALDVSTKAGWALFERRPGQEPVLKDSGAVAASFKPMDREEPYPLKYRLAADSMAGKLMSLVFQHQPEEIVVEETNRARAVYSQKLLEWIHLYLQQHLHDQDPPMEEAKYVRTGVWRHALGLKKPPEAKRNDQLLKKARDMAAAGQCSLAKAKKLVGIRGKWNKKMLAVDFVNAQYGLGLKLKDNDQAEAICLGLAYLRGAPICDGDPRPKRGEEE
jgi:hypothetical protein